MYEQAYGFRLTGLTPLLMHWDNLEWADTLEAQRTTIKEKKRENFKAGDDRCPPHTWKGCVYNDGKLVCVPTDNIRAAAMKAGARIMLDKKKTFKELSQSGLLFMDIFVPLLVNGKPLPIEKIVGIDGTFREQCEAAKKLGFELFAKRAAVGQSKHVRVRPQFASWALEGSVTVIDDRISEDSLRRIFEIIGTQIGLGDWRPGSPKSPGPYGRAKAEVFV